METRVAPLHASYTTSDFQLKNRSHHPKEDCSAFSVEKSSSAHTPMGQHAGRHVCQDAHEQLPLVHNKKSASLVSAFLLPWNHHHFSGMMIGMEAGMPMYTSLQMLLMVNAQSPPSVLLSMCTRIHGVVKSSLQIRPQYTYKSACMFRKESGGFRKYSTGV